MPRRNKRKASEYTRKQRRNMEKAMRREEYENKPSLDRHKAHSDNKRKRRARQTIRAMARSADRLIRRYHMDFRYGCMEWLNERGILDAQINADTHVLPENSDTEQYPATLPNLVAATSTDATDETNNKISIVGGLAAWLRRILTPRRA